MSITIEKEKFSRNGYPSFSDKEFKRRHLNLKKLMQEKKADAIVVCSSGGLSGTPVQYLSNWAPFWESFLIFPYDREPVLLVQLFNHMPNAREISIVPDIRYAGPIGSKPIEHVAKVLKDMGMSAKHIGLVGLFPYWELQKLESMLPDVKWVNCNEGYQEMRLIKSEEELEYMKIAASMGDKSVEAMEKQIKPGLAEYELAQIIENEYNGIRGINQIHFVLTTSMANPDCCVPRQYHSSRVIQPGDVLVTEISTSFWGYSGQILRSFTIGAEPTPLYQELYDVALRTYNDIVSVLRDGADIREVLDQADQVNREGFSIYDDLFHGFGGGYLPPVLRTRQTGETMESFELKKDMVVVVQPNVITRDEKAGVQFGDAMRTTETGVEKLHAYPMKFIRCL